MLCHSAMNAFYVCKLLENYALANPLDADRALFARDKVISENRGIMNWTAFGLDEGETEDEFVANLITTMTLDDYNVDSDDESD